MPVVALSTRIDLHAADYPTTGTPVITAATQTARMQQAISRLTIDPDDYLTADFDVYYLPAGQTGNGDTAWGKSYSGSPRYAHIAPDVGSSSVEQQYTFIHELAHKIDHDVLNPSTRASLMALMEPTPPGSGGASARWNGGSYKNRPAEVFADTFVRAYSDIQNVLQSPDYFDTQVPNGAFASFRAIVDNASSPSDTPPDPDPVEPPPPTPIQSSSGNSITVTVTPNDDDAGDKMTGAILEVYVANTTQTQINNGLLPVKTDQKLWTTTPYPTTTNLTASNLTPADYRIRVRTRDRGHDVADQSKWEWGAWSALTTVEVRFRPGAIANLNATFDTLTPTISGQMVHQDPAATIKRVRLIVTYKDPVTAAVTTMWDEWVEGSGITGGNAFSKVYAGAPLSPAREYELNGQIEDNQGVGDLPGKIGPLQTTPVKFTIVLSVGPSNMTPRTTSTLVPTRSPTLRIQNSSAFDAYELEVANEINGQGGLAWDQPLTAVASTTDLSVPWGGALPLPWGARPSWRAQITNTASGDAGPWSEWMPFAINSLPETPLFYVLDQFGNWVLLSTLTSHTIPSRDSEIQFTFNDPDRLNYGERPNWRELTILNADLTLRAKIMRRMYAPDDKFVLGTIDGFDQPGSLSTGNTGWSAGTAAALAYISSSPTPIRGQALRVTLTNLPTATVSTQDRGDKLGNAILASWTDLSQIDTFTIQVRTSAIPSGLLVKVRFEFNNAAANFSEFTVTPTSPGVWQTKTMTRVSGSNGGTVDWTKVSGIKLRISHTAGSNQSFTVVFDELKADVLELDRGYRISGRYIDTNTENVWGAPSHGGQNAILFVSEPPIVVVATPVAQWPMAYVTWVLSRGDQASYRVQITDVATGGVIDDSGWMVGEENSYRIPPERLRNSRQYRATVSVLSPYDVIGTGLSAIWSTAFEQLIPLASIELTPDATHSTVHVSFTQTGVIDAENWYSYRLFVTYTGVERLLVAEWFDQTQTEITDWSPPTGVSLFYELTQYDGWLDSVPISATTTIGQPGFWLVAPDDFTLSFPVYVTGPFRRSEGARLNAKQRLGGGEPIMVSDKTSAPTGSFSLHVNDDFESIEQVRALARKSREIPFVYWKTRLGESLKVKLGTVDETYLDAGAMSIPFTTVVWEPPVRGLTTAEESEINPLVIEAIDWLTDPA